MDLKFCKHLQTYDIGISCFYHDSAVSVRHRNTIIFASQEERHTRVKGYGEFPFLALLEALKLIHTNHVATVQPHQPSLNLRFTYYENPWKKTCRSFIYTLKSPSVLNIIRFLRALTTKNFRSFKNNILHVINSSALRASNLLISYSFGDHHLSHALSAHCSSGFTESVSLVIDGVGEFDTLSVWEFSGQQYYKNDLLTAKLPNSLGLFYALVTNFLGFKVNSGEYKVMGLAPYGRPIYVDKLKTILCDQNSFPFFSLDTNFISFTAKLIYTKKIELLFRLPARKPDDALDPIHLDIAASLQMLLEEKLKKILSYLADYYPNVPLTYSGGVALNCKANRLVPSFFNDFFIQPAANDSGGALGASFLGSYTNSKVPLISSSLSLKSIVGKLTERSPQFSPLLGNDISDEEALRSLEKYNCTYTKLNSDYDLARLIAKQIAYGSIIGLARGRMEFGPRALGSRSILCDPRKKENQLRLNSLVKKREEFRPFAPCVLEDYFYDYFSGTPNPYMLLTSQCLDACSTYTDSASLSRKIISSDFLDSLIPSVVHVDLSSRVQVVSASIYPFLAIVLQEFMAITGIPVLINTSFNERGEPIVMSSDDALQSFLSIDLDVLVLNNFVVFKADNIHSRLKARLFKPD